MVSVPMRQGLVAAQAAAANLQRTQAFLQALLERAANSHRFANAFIGVMSASDGRAQAPACGNFSKAKRGILVAT